MFSIENDQSTLIPHTRISNDFYFLYLCQEIISLAMNQTRLTLRDFFRTLTKMKGSLYKYIYVKAKRHWALYTQPPHNEPRAIQSSPIHHKPIKNNMCTGIGVSSCLNTLVLASPMCIPIQICYPLDWLLCAVMNMIRLFSTYLHLISSMSMPTEKIIITIHVLSSNTQQ